MSVPRLKKMLGFTLIETLIGISILVIMATGILAAFNYLSKVVSTSRAKVAALSIAADEFEFMKNLPYADVGIVGSIPAGVLSHTSTTTRGGFDFFVTRTIRNIDDPFDGTIGGAPNDTAPADYKLTEITVDCITCASFTQVRESATVAPANLELSQGGGALFIQVLDGNGAPVPGANVHVLNTTLSPNLVIDDVTNAQGTLALVDVPQSVGGYNTTVTKSGYSSDGTYPQGGVSNPNPVKTDSTVSAGTVTQVTFVIDKTSTVTITTANQLCTPVGDVSFDVDGAKLIGTSPDVLKYSSSFSTDPSGTRTLSAMEWDQYQFSITDASYDLAGSIPFLPLTLAPNTTENLTLLVNPAVAKALLVTVKDGGTGLPISGAIVAIAKTGFSASSVTGYGSLTQTDWSGGAGQATFTDPSEYFDQSGSIEIMGPSGELKLKETGGVYASSGYLTSSTFDTGIVSNFSSLSFAPTDQPASVGQGSVKFQVASNNDNATWEYVGPDDTASTYYTSSNGNIGNHNGHRYLRYRIFLSTDDTDATPNVSDIFFTFTSSCVPPGQAFFNGLAGGTYTLTVTHPSYQTFIDTDVQISPAFQTADVSLTP